MQPISPKQVHFALALLLICPVAGSPPVAVGHSPDGLSPADRLLDPKYDPYNLPGYIASYVLAGLALGLVLAVALAQTFSVFKWGARWMGCMVIGAYTFALGFGLRFDLHVRPDSKGLYIAESFFVTLPVCAFIAGDYILLGRLARWLGSGKHLVVAPHRITTIFVISDITTFLLQAGGAISVGATTIKSSELGSHIFFGALIIQLISFVIFTCFFLRFMYRVRKFERDAWTLHRGNQWYNDWRALALALGISCIGILVRSFYRVVELSQGFRGPIARNEALFYALDTLPLFVAISVYVPFWPGRFIPREPAMVPTESEKQGET